MKFALLMTASVGYGMVAAALFHRFANLRQIANRITAHILELRLFVDEPSLVFRAQRDLFHQNMLLLRQIALPCGVLAVALALAYPLVDREFGYGPLQPGRTTIATAPTEIQLPPDLIPETPPVHIPRLHQVAWRLHTAPQFSGVFPAGLQVRYPRAELLGCNWVLWFVLSSGIGAAIPPILLFLK